MVQVVTSPMAPKRRGTRSPQHAFRIEKRPWQIQPFLLAPVLPGETLRNLMWQTRVISDPLNSSIIGWWFEQYFFYVKHRDLDISSDLQDMMLDQDKDMSSHHAAADASYNHAGNGINFAEKCLEAVVNEYFRDEGEAYDDHTLGGMPVAQIGIKNWLDSATNDADLITAEDFDVDTDADTVIEASEVDNALRTWRMMRQNALTHMDYEDFLRTYGVRVPEVDDPKPELIRYNRDWTYPTNTIDPTDGSPTSACSWSISGRADKDRFFKEPGFIFGCSVCRPKIYLEDVDGSLAHHMDDAYSWLPAVLSDDPGTSLKKFAALAEPLSSNTDAYWVDMKDLFLYGDQFVNMTLTTSHNKIAHPTPTLDWKYAGSGTANDLFVSASVNKINYDGICNLTIASSLKDTSPMNAPRLVT